MLVKRERELNALRVTTSTLEQRIQQLSAELAELRAHIVPRDDSNLVAVLADRVSRAQVKADHELERFLLAIHSVAETAAMHATLSTRRGRAGGLARAPTAWRYLDGTFMPDTEKSEGYRKEYERDAAGGRARAASALRAADGTFVGARSLSHTRRS
jgi:hypothetical protein